MNLSQDRHNDITIDGVKRNIEAVVSPRLRTVAANYQRYFKCMSAVIEVRRYEHTRAYVFIFGGGLEGVMLCVEVKSEPVSLESPAADRQWLCCPDVGRDFVPPQRLQNREES